MLGFLKEIIENKKDRKETKLGNISMWSYQRFCRFYGYTVFIEPDFEKKMEKLCELVTVYKETNIKEISKKMNIPIKECMYKLNYLKNKKWISNDYYINGQTYEIKKCSTAELNLLNKYYDMVYLKHYSIYEMAKELKKSDNSLDINNTKEIIYKELQYMSSISLLNGIKFDEEKHEILYYTLEKRKLSEKFVTLNCPHCGALVDIPKFDSARCEYCSTIVEDTYSKEGENK